MPNFLCIYQLFLEQFREFLIKEKMISLLIALLQENRSKLGSSIIITISTGLHKGKIIAMQIYISVRSFQG